MDMDMADRGASLLRASGPQGVEKVSRLMDMLFHNDAEGRNAFCQKLFGQGSPLEQPMSPETVAAYAWSTINRVKNNIAKLISTLNSNHVQPSALFTLHEKIEDFFKCGPEAALFMFAALQRQVSANTLEQQGGLIKVDVSTQDEGNIMFCLDRSDLWKSCKMVASFILLIASPNDPAILRSSLKWQSRSLGGIPTYADTQMIPSASFPLAFQSAKTAALDQGKTSVVAVSLVDVHIFELGLETEQYFSFAHTFAFGIGPEGVIIWQAWGKHGYPLEEHLRKGRSRLRDWAEAERFVDDFDRLANSKGTWSVRKNKLYKKLFHIDINSKCGPTGPERPVTPKFKGWVRIKTIKDVSYENVAKFSWSSGDQ